MITSDQVPKPNHASEAITVPPNYEYAARERGPDEWAPEDVRYRFAQMNQLVEGSHNAAEQNTHELMTMFPAATGVTIGDRRFLLSDVYADVSGRKFAVGYTSLEGSSVAPRLFYKSNSDATAWRSMPEYVVYEEDGKQKSYFSKGDTMSHGYVRETKVHRGLSDVLSSLEAEQHHFGGNGSLTSQNLLSHFTAEKLGEFNTYANEAFELNIQGIKEQAKVYRPGAGFPPVDGKPAREVLANIQLAPHRVPDFATAESKVRTRTTRDKYLGDVTIDTYVSRDGMVEWNMAHAEDGTVWVNGLTTPEHHAAGGITSYGTTEEVLVGGVLDNKPIEYVEQLDGLEEGVDFEKIPGTQYAKLKVLDNLAPIREYRAATGIQRAA